MCLSNLLCADNACTFILSQGACQTLGAPVELTLALDGEAVATGGRVRGIGQILVGKCVKGTVNPLKL